MSQRNESMPFHPFQNMFQTYFGGLDTGAQSLEPMVKGMARWQLETMGLVREERGLAYSVYSGLGPGRYGASYFVGLQTRLEAVDDAVRLVKEEMGRMGRETVTSRELDSAKSYLIGSYPLRTDTSGKMAGLLVSVEENELGLDWPDRFKAGISRVTAADVRRMATTSPL